VDPEAASGWTEAAAQTAVAGMIVAAVMTAAADAMTGPSGQTGPTDQTEAGVAMADAITSGTCFVTFLLFPCSLCRPSSARPALNYWTAF
jgi:hypothetical protein